MDSNGIGEIILNLLLIGSPFDLAGCKHLLVKSPIKMPQSKLYP